MVTDIIPPVVEIGVVVALLSAIIYQTLGAVRKVFRFRF